MPKLNRADQVIEALRWLAEAESEIDVFADPQTKLAVAQVHATLATVPDSVAGKVDQRSVHAVNKAAAKRRVEQ